MFTASDSVMVDSCAGRVSAAHQICEICRCRGEKCAPELPVSLEFNFRALILEKQIHQPVGVATGEVDGSLKSGEFTVKVKIIDLMLSQNHQNCHTARC